MADHIELDHRFFERFRYGVIDASLRDEIPDSCATQVIAPAFLGTDTDRCPVLVDFAHVPWDVRGPLLDRLEADTVARAETLLSIALASDASLDRLGAHLAQRLAVRRNANAQPLHFRYHDPGTFIQLPSVIGEAGMFWLLGPIAGVAVPWLGEWRYYPRPESMIAESFRLAAHLPALLQIGIINRVVTRLREVRDQEDWCRRCETTRQHVTRASEVHGLELRDDLVAFALHAWSCHPGFDAHPTIQTLLAELATAEPDDELDYRELTARLEPEDWERIAHDLTAEHSAQGISR